VGLGVVDFCVRGRIDHHIVAGNRRSDRFGVGDVELGTRK